MSSTTLFLAFLVGFASGVDGALFLREALPENPYNDDNSVVAVNQAAAATGTRTAAGSEGWAYYNGSAGGNAVFYANSDTQGENDY